jgi:putative transposase
LATGDRSLHRQLVVGDRTNGWKQAFGALALNYPEQINPYL